jgi:hypothetical protein
MSHQPSLMFGRKAMNFGNLERQESKKKVEENSEFSEIFENDKVSEND